MGCCVSVDEAKPRHDQPYPCISKSPPRAEEETVKEVLSETRPGPITGPAKVVGPGLNPDPQPDLVQIVKPTKPKPMTPQGQNGNFTPRHLPINPVKSPGPGLVCTTPEPEEASDVSCSLSESISNTTLREDDHEVIQKVYKPIMPQGQNGNFARPRAGASPGRRRSDPSPTRRRSDPSPTRTRNQGPGRADGPRRSRSPAARSNGGNVGQSPSGKRAGLSPGRVRMVSGPDENEGKKMEEVNERRRNNENESEWEGPNESLENPLVSLECFIFL